MEKEIKPKTSEEPKTAAPQITEPIQTVTEAAKGAQRTETTAKTPVWTDLEKFQIQQDAKKDAAKS